MPQVEFDTHHREAPSAFVWGFVKMESLKAVTAKVRCYTSGTDAAGVSFVAVGSGANGARTDVKMYRLPAADAGFTRDVGVLSSGQAAWELPGGLAFQQSMLRPEDVPKLWRHRAVQTRDAGYGIVHAWRSAGRAMLMQHWYPRNEMLVHPLFQWATANVHVIEAAWLMEPPGVVTGA